MGRAVQVVPADPPVPSDPENRSKVLGKSINNKKTNILVQTKNVIFSSWGGVGVEG